MASLTIDITPELARQLQEGAARRGVATAEYARLALEAWVTSQNALQSPPTSPSPEDQGAQAAATTVGDEILATVEVIWSQVPEEEVAKLPPDFSSNLDHYLYG